jgi:Protein of unknown function (DUF1592)/Protein of unknown function (DUF1588)/Protein of unknown function (DUF1585)/Protein of unknown function (DUF1587)/Protein of unknown function (DUF1595)
MTSHLPLIAVLVGLVTLAATGGAADDSKVRDLISTYCMSCHSSAKHKGDTDLEKLPTDTPIALGVWESVRHALAEQDMPPAEKKQPTQAERDAAIAWIDRLLDGPGGETPTDPGWVTVHRLTRTEYNRTIQDLLGIGGNPAEVFPADSAGGNGSFDNQSETLFVSPILLERLLDLSLELIEKTKPERLNLVAAEKDKKGVVTPAAQRKAAENSLVAFLPRAWRRPVPRVEAQNLLKVYDKALKKSNVTPEDALRLTYAAALTSPNFIFRNETSRPGTEPYPLSAYDIANRLSYFLWSTMPDEALFKAAEDGSLSKPEGISAQIARMLADPKAEILARQFMGQWLGTDELATGLGPDPKLVKGYSASLRSAMITEPAAFLQGLLKDNGSLTDLIDCNYVYVNGELADLYGISGVRGEAFTKVAVTDGRRGGLVTMAGVLAITSRPSRTSPVIRGKWILKELLSYPPPPPPPNVPALPETENGKPNVGTLRQRLERHRADPTCNSCHQRIDPLGFGLENFDAIGRWRTRGDQGEGLDTIGTLPSGEMFNGPQELKKLLKNRQDRIMTTVVERMLSYALGRGIERHDRTTVRQIAKNIAADQFRAQTLIREIALSLPFRFKRNPTITPVTVAKDAPPPAK